MGWIAQAITTAATAFAATNMDDGLMLMLFFSQVNATFRPRQIVMGQYLGFGVLILASLPGFLGGLWIPDAWIGLLGLLPILIGLQQGLSPTDKDGEVQGVVCDRPSIPGRRPAWARPIQGIDPPTYHVAAVTIANGGDNIGIYVPLFASSNPMELGITLMVFAGLIAVWCGIAYQLARFPAIAPILSRHSRWIVPLVLIGLGLSILIENRTYQLFGVA